MGNPNRSPQRNATYVEKRERPEELDHGDRYNGGWRPMTIEFLHGGPSLLRVVGLGGRRAPDQSNARI